MGVILPSQCPQLRISPERIIAPVGSEVIFKAQICGCDGHLVTNEPINWNLDRCGPGLIANLDGHEAQQAYTWWDPPRRLDNWTATGATAIETVRLYRGTPDPRDDIQLLRGDAVVTVTSCAEGCTTVTACAAEMAGLNQASATIQWVDADWVFPLNCANEEVGRPHVLTTTVARRSNGAPLPGWVVKYNVASGASLGYGGGNTVEQVTDVNGRASVEVSPSDASGGVATVGIAILAPPSTAAGSAQPLELSRTTSMITWRTGIAPTPVPASAAPAPSLPPGLSPLTPTQPQAPPAPGMSPPPTFAPPASPPTSPAPTSPYSATPPAAPTAPTGQPQLDVQLRRTGSDQLAVGDYTSFDVTVSNRGDGIARRIEVLDRFDRGLRHPEAKPGEYAVKYSGVRDLAPGESQTIRLTFQVVEAGTHCHEATISAEGADPVSKRECITARQAVLEVEAPILRQRIVGESAEFRAVVKNVGDVAATNVQIVAKCDPALKPTRAEEGHKTLPDGSLLFEIDRLEPGERRSIRMEAQCVAPSNNARTKFLVTADGGVTAGAETGLEILPQLDGGARAPGAVAPSTSGLKLTIGETKNPARVREKQVVYVNIENSGQQTETKVAVRVILPPELTPDPTQIQPQNDATILGQEIRFTTIAELRPGEKRQYVVPVTPNRAGQIQIRAQVAAASLRTPTTVDSNVVEILP
jgi:hypothetical protein